MIVTFRKEKEMNCNLHTLKIRKVVSKDNPSNLY